MVGFVDSNYNDEEETISEYSDQSEKGSEEDCSEEESILATLEENSLLFQNKDLKLIKR